MLYDKLLEKGRITLEEYKIKKLEAFKNYRSLVFKAYDIYKTNVIYGLEIETEEEKQELITWYNIMRDYTENMVVGDNFPEIPEKIRYYMGG